MTDAADIGVDKATLRHLTKAMQAAFDELEDLSGTDSQLGAGFENLAITKKEAGHKGLADTFEDFCESWEWGVRALMQDANTLAEKLGLSVGMLFEEDQYRDGTFKVVTNALSPTGNPHLSEEEVAKQGYGDILKPKGFDYSGESFERAGDESAQAWRDVNATARDPDSLLGSMVDDRLENEGVSEADRAAVQEQAQREADEGRQQVEERWGE